MFCRRKTLKRPDLVQDSSPYSRTFPIRNHASTRDLNLGLGHEIGGHGVPSGCREWTMPKTTYWVSRFTDLFPAPHLEVAVLKHLDHLTGDESLHLRAPLVDPDPLNLRSPERSIRDRLAHIRVGIQDRGFESKKRSNTELGLASRPVEVAESTFVAVSSMMCTVMGIHSSTHCPRAPALKSRCLAQRGESRRRPGCQWSRHHDWRLWNAWKQGLKATCSVGGEVERVESLSASRSVPLRGLPQEPP